MLKTEQMTLAIMSRPLYTAHLSALRELEPVINHFISSEPIVMDLNCGVLLPDSDCKTVSDHIHTVLPLNYLKRLVVEEILDHVIQTKGKACLRREDQLLLYIRGEGGVGKSRVVKALELGFALLNRRAELIITAPTGCAAESIGGSTVHTALKINTRRANDNVSKIGSLWTRRLALVVDEVSIINLKLLTIMDKQLRKPRGSDFSSTALFGGLPLVVLIGDFYQFAPVSGHALWDEALGEDEIHGKTVWNNFTYVITLTEQMRQKNDSVFQALLKRARNGELNLEDVDTLNYRVATNLPIS